MVCSVEPAVDGLAHVDVEVEDSSHDRKVPLVVLMVLGNRVPLVAERLNEESGTDVIESRHDEGGGRRTTEFELTNEALGHNIDTTLLDRERADIAASEFGFERLGVERYFVDDSKPRAQKALIATRFAICGDPSDFRVEQVPMDAVCELGDDTGADDGVVWFDEKCERWADSGYCAACIECDS